APGGAALVVEGTGLGTGGRVQIGDMIVTTSAWTPTRITFAAPNPSMPYNGPLKLFWLVNYTWVLKASLPSFTLLPAVVSSGITDGTGKPISAATEDDEIWLNGPDLGLPGRVRFFAADTSYPIGDPLILTWTRTRIGLKAPRVWKLAGPYRVEVWAAGYLPDKANDASPRPVFGPLTLNAAPRGSPARSYFQPWDNPGTT